MKPLGSRALKWLPWIAAGILLLLAATLGVYKTAAGHFQTLGAWQPASDSPVGESQNPVGVVQSLVEMAESPVGESRLPVGIAGLPVGIAGLPVGLSKSPVIGARVWQPIEEEVIPRESPDWQPAVLLFDSWNNGTLVLDEDHFYANRPELEPQRGAHEPGFSWFVFLTHKGTQEPVRFTPKPAPLTVQLPRCNPAEFEPRPPGVSICVMVNNEEFALPAWLNYNYHLGVSQIVLYDDGSVDRTAEVAKSYGGFVRYEKWEKPFEGSSWTGDQINVYKACVREELERGAKWVGAIDVDEFVVFDDPNQRLDTFLAEFDEKHDHVGQVSFTWRMMHSDAISLPDPAYPLLDVRYACKDESDDRHHVKSFVKAEAMELWKHPHFCSIKEGFRQYDVTGGIIDPPGPFASRFISAPARLNHYRLLSLQEWLRKAHKRHARKAAAERAHTYFATRDGDYSLSHLENTLGNCFSVQIDEGPLLNVIARQGCL